jgi:hypothetical protein
VLASFTTISAPQSPSRHRNQTATTTEKEKKPGGKKLGPQLDVYLFFEWHKATKGHLTHLTPRTRRLQRLYM